MRIQSLLKAVASSSRSRSFPSPAHLLARVRPAAANTKPPASLVSTRQARYLSKSNALQQQTPRSRFDTSLQSDIRESSIDPSSPTVLSNIVDSSDDLLSITHCSEKGVALSDGTVTKGGLIIAEGQAFLWDVQAPEAKPGSGIDGLWKDWENDRFALLEVMSSRPGQYLLKVHFHLHCGTWGRIAVSDVSTQRFSCSVLDADRCQSQGG